MRRLPRLRSTTDLETFPLDSVPGFFAYNRTFPDGTTQEKQNVRVSRIYVSQKYTAWNGRKSTYTLRPKRPPGQPS
jgi:hypothetical protein